MTDDTERSREELRCLPAVMAAVETLDLRSRLNLLLFAAHEAAQEILEGQLPIPGAWTEERERLARKFRIMAIALEVADLNAVAEHSAREGSLTSRRDALKRWLTREFGDDGAHEG